MDRGTFRRFLDAFAANLDSLTLHNYGEPLLHPQVAEFVAEARAAGIPHVDMTTNGQLMDAALARDLVRAGLSVLRVSVDTTDPDRYQDYRRGGRLERVLTSVALLAEARASAGADGPRIEAQGLLMREVRPSADVERQLLDAGCDAVRWKTFNIFMSGESGVREAMRYLPRDLPLTRYESAVPEPASRREEIRLCRWPWDRIVVLADGTIVPCCHDFDGEHALGSVGSAEMWATEARRRFMVRRILAPESIEVCRRCSSAVPALAVRRTVSAGRSGREP
jgi:radical SAM protein with 4Fe4S-binding SPASM domain